jgi:hypothetical protein
MPEAEVLAGVALEPRVAVAPEATEEVREDALPEASMDVVVRSPEIPETAAASRDGLELLADDLINPAMVACNLESMRRAEQWMKVRDSILE